MPPIKKKSGGLFTTNKAAYVDSTLAANKNLDWVKRLHEPNAPTIQLPGEPDRSTHFMGDDGQGYVFPTVVRFPGKKGLTYLGDRAEDYARETNTGIQFPSKTKGDFFGHNGYKQGTGVNNSINSQGVPYNDSNYGKPSMKRKPIQKAAKGLHEVTVPPAGNNGDVLNSAIQGGLAGSQFGPWGAAAGVVGGLALGAFQKKGQDVANKSALEHNSFVGANNLASGVDPTSVQRTTYGEGTEGTEASKPIEVEKDELVFRKVGNRFKLKADFQGGKTHKQGGEPYQAQQGDVIFPGKDRKKVLSHLGEGNHSALEGMRMRLPEDTNAKGEAAEGIGGITPYTYFQGKPLYVDKQNQKGAYGKYQQALDGLTTGSSTFLPEGQGGNPYPYAVLKDGNGSYYRHEQATTLSARNPLTDGSMGTNPSITPPATLPYLSGVGVTNTGAPSSLLGTTLPVEGLTAKTGPGNLLKYSSVANNLIQGYSKPETVQENYLDPLLNQYRDRSDPLRAQSNRVAAVQGSNARGASGGNVGNLRANQQQAQVENFTRRQEIDNREQVRADQVQDGNIDLLNRAREVNTQKRDQYAQLNAQARANQQAYKDAGFGQLTSLGEAQEQEKYQRSRDAKLDNRDQLALKYLNQMTHYTTPGDGNILWNPQGSGYSGLGDNTTTSQKVDQDVYGRVKSSTTTSTKSGIKRRKK